MPCLLAFPSARPPCSAPASWARRSPRISPTPAFPSSCSTSPAKEGDPNGIVNKAIAGLASSSPRRSAPPDRAAHIDAANYDRDLARLADCDLVIEAIAERMDWKRDLYAKIAPHLAPHAIVASNTSGLSINALAEALPAAMRPRFCGIHFFNPPRYMHLVELIAQQAHRSGAPRRARDVPRHHARQGRRAREGHAELHRQPRRHLLDAGDDGAHRDLQASASTSSMR